MRTRPQWTPQIVRERIRVTAIVTRLQKHVRGEIEMSATQVRAAEVLLNKTLPNLAQTDLSIDGAVGTYDVSDQPLSADEWAAKFAVPLDS